MAGKKQKKGFKDHKLASLDKKRSKGVQSFVILFLAAMVILGVVGCIMGHINGTEY